MKVIVFNSGYIIKFSNLTFAWVAKGCFFLLLICVKRKLI